MKAYVKDTKKSSVGTLGYIEVEPGMKTISGATVVKVRANDTAIIDTAAGERRTVDTLGLDIREAAKYGFGAVTLESMLEKFSRVRYSDEIDPWLEHHQKSLSALEKKDRAVLLKEAENKRRMRTMRPPSEEVAVVATGRASGDRFMWVRITNRQASGGRYFKMLGKRVGEPNERGNVLVMLPNGDVLPWNPEDLKNEKDRAGAALEWAEKVEHERQKKSKSKYLPPAAFQRAYLEALENCETERDVLALREQLVREAKDAGGMPADVMGTIQGRIDLKLSELRPGSKKVLDFPNAASSEEYARVEVKHKLRGVIGLIVWKGAGGVTLQFADGQRIPFTVNQWSPATKEEYDEQQRAFAVNAKAKTKFGACPECGKRTALHVITDEITSHKNDAGKPCTGEGQEPRATSTVKTTERKIS